MPYLFNPSCPCCVVSGECSCSISVPIELTGNTTFPQSVDLAPYVDDLQAAAPNCQLRTDKKFIWRLRIVGFKFPDVSAIGPVKSDATGILIAERSHSMFGWRPWEGSIDDHTGLKRNSPSVYWLDDYNFQEPLADEAWLDIGCVDCDAGTVQWPDAEALPMNAPEFDAAAFAGESGLDPTHQDIRVGGDQDIEPDTRLIGTPSIEHTPFCSVETLVWDAAEGWSFAGGYYDSFSASSGRNAGVPDNHDDLAIDGYSHTVTSRRMRIPKNAKLLHLFTENRRSVGIPLDYGTENRMTNSQKSEIEAWLQQGDRILLMHAGFVTAPFVPAWTRTNADLTSQILTNHPLAEGITGFIFFGSNETDGGFNQGFPQFTDNDHRGIELDDGDAVILDAQERPIVSVRDYGPEPTSKIVVGSHRMMDQKFLRNCIEKRGTF